MIHFFPKPYIPFGGDINAKVDLSTYATKTDLKNATGIDTYKLDSKSGLACLKTETDKTDIDKFLPVPVNLSKISNAVKK